MVGSVAEWSKALVLGTSHFDGVGSNPTTAIFFFSFPHFHTPDLRTFQLFISKLVCIVVLAEMLIFGNNYCITS